jgi:hypothetical protein
MAVIFFDFDSAMRSSLNPSVLESLKGNQLGIITREPKENIARFLKQSGTAGYFEPRLYIRRGTDSGTTYRKAVKAAGEANGPIYYVDRDQNELRHAEETGIHPVADLALLAVKKPAVNIDHIADCMAEARDAALDSNPGPDAETNFEHLVQRLEAAKVRMPPLYVDAAHKPFVEKLHSLGANGFSQILISDPTRERAGGLLLDISHAILQNGERFLDIATDAFEEVVTDLYDGFLSAQDRNGIKMPDRAVLPPLVKWGNPDFGPYTFPIDATEIFDVRCGVVNMPPANATRGIVAWAALGHETAGHDVIHADHGLEAEIADMVQQALLPLQFGLADYWSTRIDETASDVMGILNMGPAPAIGLIAYFRGLNAAFSGSAKLRNRGPAGDGHPADIVRGFLAAETVRLLSFAGAGAWADAIDGETTKDIDAHAQTFSLANKNVPIAVAKESAKITARIIATTKFKTLHKHALIEIQDWRDTDEAVVTDLIPALTTTTNAPASITGSGIFAAHVVSAAVMAALSGKGTPTTIFKRMVVVLKSMHDTNPAWGPLHVLHPSTIYRDFSYVRQ